MTLTPTEIESLRIAIAEEMGMTAYDEIPSYGFDSRGVACHIPPYTTSLDAIQAAAMERFDGDLARQFQFQLWKVRKDEDFIRYEWQLTAVDWCIAFARTAKIWRYKE